MLKKLTAALFTLCALISAALAIGVSAAEPARETVALPVIMYHHILKNPQSHGAYVVSPDTLESDLRYLKSQGCTAIGYKTLLAWVRGETELPEKPVMLTFDDGQESFSAYALPLLEQYDMCAVLAIVGSIADAYTESGDHNIAYSYLSWPAIGALSASPHVEFAVHTNNLHSNSVRQGCAILPGESAEAYRAMLSADLEAVENRFFEYAGSVPECFAYPFGCYCAEARELLTERGYKVAFTCDEKVNMLTGDVGQLMDLGRYNRPSGISSADFFAKLING